MGRAALERQRAEGIARRRVTLTAHDPKVLLLGNEPIVVDGEIRGHTTSAAYGHTLGRAVAMGYVRLDDRPAGELVEGARLELEVALERTPADASLKAPFDPSGQRLRTNRRRP